MRFLMGIYRDLVVIYVEFMGFKMIQGWFVGFQGIELGFH